MLRHKTVYIEISVLIFCPLPFIHQMELQQTLSLLAFIRLFIASAKVYRDASNIYR